MFCVFCVEVQVQGQVLSVKGQVLQSSVMNRSLSFAMDGSCSHGEALWARVPEKRRAPLLTEDFLRLKSWSTRISVCCRRDLEEAESGMTWPVQYVKIEDFKDHLSDSLQFQTEGRCCCRFDKFQLVNSFMPVLHSMESIVREMLGLCPKLESVLRVVDHPNAFPRSNPNFLGWQRWAVCMGHVSDMAFVAEGLRRRITEDLSATSA